MSYSSTKECIEDLERHGQLLRIKEEVDPHLEMAEIHRRIYAQQGPAILFEKVKGSPFPAVCNLYGTVDRIKFIFRDSIPAVESILKAKIEPDAFLKNPLKALSLIGPAFKGLPKRISPNKAPATWKKTSIDQLPATVSWPMDGGRFITLPQVFSRELGSKGLMKSNLGMYRIQLTGNDYKLNDEIGLHYQIHRGIGVHHQEHLDANKPFRVSIFVGGPPANTFAAVLPLPEGLPEVTFAGMMAGKRFRYTEIDEHVIAADADFCIVGTIQPNTKPEGPFGDHLGYYSLKHDFPTLSVEAVYHREDAIWPFTTVGRPPQEDTSFGALIHELTDPVIPKEIPGLAAIHAVDAAGVHPLLLATGKERYTPYCKSKRPQELLTVANAILGKGQLSLAKFLIIAEEQDKLDIHDLPQFFQHFLERVNWQRDLHFQTNTTIDTLDYSGEEINEGSKVIMACHGESIRQLATTPPNLELANGFSKVTSPLPGILAITGPQFSSHDERQKDIDRLEESLRKNALDEWPLIILCDDSEFCAKTLNNFLWVSFTRANPSHDIYGLEASTRFKHWGCKGSLIIDAGIKPQHAPPLIEDPEITARVDQLFKKLELN